MDKSIGSYFAIELRNGNNGYYTNGIMLNLGRNALEYIVKVFNVKKIYVPYYTCDVLFIPLKKLNISVQFYRINKNLIPEVNYESIHDDEYFLYINYFGVKNYFIKELAGKVKNLIVDNSQAFFSKPVKNIPTFYSIRKFFGVPDGALLLNAPKNLELKRDKSSERFMYLLQRIENEVEVGYNKYQEVEASLANIDMLEMSLSTEKVYKTIDFNKHKKVRKQNFKFLHRKFKCINQLKIGKYEAPLAYPLLIDKGDHVKKTLIDNRIYLPTYWPNIIESLEKDTFEYHMALNCIPIPIDLRYNEKDLLKIVNLIKTLL